MFWSLLTDDKAYLWLTKFEFTPFFWVWALSVLIWFFLEVSVWAAHYFNTKHTYVSDSHRLSVFFLQLVKLLRNKKKFFFCKIVYSNVL